MLSLPPQSVGTIWHTPPVDSRLIHNRSITQIQLGVELCEEVQIEITLLILVDIRVSAGGVWMGGFFTQLLVRRSSQPIAFLLDQYSPRIIHYAAITPYVLCCIHIAA